MTLFLRQALTLQMSPSPATGAAIVFENRNLLGLPTEVPEPLTQPLRRGPGGQGRRRASVSASEAEGGVRRGSGAGIGIGPGGRSSPGQGHTRQSSSQIGALPEMIAKGLLDRGEALGINKAFLHAVSEVKVTFMSYPIDWSMLNIDCVLFQRNLPDLSASMARSPGSQSASYTAYPLLDERPIEERPPWEPRTRFEMERDVSEMLVEQKMLGESVSWIVDTLLLDEGEIPTEEAKTIKTRKREALESLAYVRDVLLGSVTTIEAERLISDEEVKKRKEKARREQEELEREQSSLEQPIISPPPRSHPAAPPSVAHARPIASRRSSPQHSSAPRPTAPSFVSPRSEIPNPLSPATSSSSAGTPSANISRAPWNYTRSDFSNAISPVPVPSLAPPPRASTTTSRSPSHTTTPSGSYPPPPPSSQSQSSGQPVREQAPLQKVHHDPLGVLR